MIIKFETGKSIEFLTNSLIGWDFRSQNLHRAIFNGICLDKAFFNKSHLRNVNIENTSCINADFTEVALMNAYLRNSNFSGSIFTRSLPIAAKFNNSILRYTNFNDANVSGASFDDTDVCGASLLFLSYENASFKNAIFDQQTKWPKGFDPIKKGAIPKKF